jgi:hypothetical protein
MRRDSVDGRTIGMINEPSSSDLEMADHNF